MDINQSIDPSQINDPTIQQLVTQAQQGSASNDVHPATDQIAQLAFALHSGSMPQPAPNQSNLSYIRPQVPGTGLGSFISKLFTGKPLMHPGDPILATNQAPDQTGLPSAMQVPSIGTDANGNNLYAVNDVDNLHKLAGQAFTFGQKMNLTHPTVSPDLATAIASGDQDKVNKQWDLEHPGQSMPSDILKMTSTSKNVGYRGQLANAIDTRAGIARLLAAFQVGGGPGMQKMASNADTALGFANKAMGIVQQIEAQGGKATAIQSNELGTALRGITTNGSGVITDHGMDSFVPNTLVKKYGSGLEYFTNTQQPVDFSGFMPQFKDLLQREIMKNQEVSNAAASFGIGVAQGLDPQIARLLQGVRQNNPMTGTPGSTTPAPGLGGQPILNPGTPDNSASRVPQISPTSSRKSLNDIFGGK